MKRRRKGALSGGGPIASHLNNWAGQTDATTHQFRTYWGDGHGAPKWRKEALYFSSGKTEEIWVFFLGILGFTVVITFPNGTLSNSAWPFLIKHLFSPNQSLKTDNYPCFLCFSWLFLVPKCSPDFPLQKQLISRIYLQNLKKRQAKNDPVPFLPSLVYCNAAPLSDLASQITSHQLVLGSIP